MQQGQHENFPSDSFHRVLALPQLRHTLRRCKLGPICLQILSLPTTARRQLGQVGYPPLHGPSIWLQAAITTDASNWEQTRSCSTFRPEQPVQNLKVLMSIGPQKWWRSTYVFAAPSGQNHSMSPRITRVTVQQRCSATTECDTGEVTAKVRP